MVRRVTTADEGTGGVTGFNLVGPDDTSDSVSLRRRWMTNVEGFLLDVEGQKTLRKKTPCTLFKRVTILSTEDSFIFRRMSFHTE